MSFNEEVQFDHMCYHSALEPSLGGVQGIPVVHLIDCCIRWSACVRSQSRTTNDSSDCISLAWVNVFGGMHILRLDGEIVMRGKEVDDYTKHHTRRHGSLQGTMRQSVQHCNVPKHKSSTNHYVPTLQQYKA